ncbi:GAF domain-containing protein [Microbacterium sp. NPDC057659]|uniref:GAF domain-containing protein n=1 Tax=Microbacterium sp. NPDC057659 TaxID=3346198 RepID=UPI00366B7B94
MELPHGDLEEFRAEHPLAGVIEMVRRLLLPGSREDSGVVIAVGDRAGRMLWIDGDLGMRVGSGEVGIVEGANWAEERMGTTAPGTALVLGRSVQIHEYEHFNRSIQPWSCSAAPVFDPETREILGVIDVTGRAEAASPQAGMLIDATARAVEAELLVARLRARALAPARPAPAHAARRSTSIAPPTLQVLGRSRARLESSCGGSAVDLSLRHAEILLMLAVHPQGLSAERLGEVIYGDRSWSDTLRPEMVRLRKVLAGLALDLHIESRPYRLTGPIETDAQNVLSLLGRGAHRVALSAYRGAVLPDSRAPGVEEFRETVRASLREVMVGEAALDVLLSYADTDDGADDPEVLRLCLRMLPARSPKRAALVARAERLERD